MVALTSAGNARAAVLSPDGSTWSTFKPVETGKASVGSSGWRRQRCSDRSANSGPGHLGARSDSDGAAIDFGEKFRRRRTFSLWRVPFLGGVREARGRGQQRAGLVA
jgi:hypothetical protein